MNIFNLAELYLSYLFGMFSSVRKRWMTMDIHMHLVAGGQNGTESTVMIFEDL